MLCATHQMLGQLLLQQLAKILIDFELINYI